MSNPYNADPYATAWQQGYDTGMQDPGASTPDFSGWGYDEDTTTYIATVWEEGALAGREWGSSGGGGGPEPSTAPPAHDPDAGSPGAPPHEVAQVHTVKFWLNAFIEPDHVDGPPGYGIAYDYEYFSGDGRGFSSDITASARMHSEVEISGVDTATPAISSQAHHCAPSHALNSSMTVVDTKTATPRANFDAPTVRDGVVSVGYAGAANMPLITGSPDIDANGTFSVNAVTGAVEFSGSIDAFPWFEAYASVNGRAPVTLMTENPTGSGPMDLLGDANRGVYGTGNGL